MIPTLLLLAHVVALSHHPPLLDFLMHYGILVLVALLLLFSACFIKVCLFPVLGLHIHFSYSYTSPRNGTINHIICTILSHAFVPVFF